MVPCKEKKRHDSLLELAISVIDPQSARGCRYPSHQGAIHHFGYGKLGGYSRNLGPCIDLTSIYIY